MLPRVPAVLLPRNDVARRTARRRLPDSVRAGTPPRLPPKQLGLSFAFEGNGADPFGAIERDGGR